LFCQLRINSNENTKKLIIIDEADSLTEVAQEALRRTVENFSNIVRFIFICNYPSKIIEAIQSRCILFHFKNISDFIMIRNVIKILSKEEISFSIKGLEMLIFLVEGDMRRLLNETEIISKSFLTLAELSVKMSCFVPNIFMIADFLYFTFNKNYILASEIFFDILNGGYSVVETINGIFKFLKKIKLFEVKKIKITKKICEFQIRLFENRQDLNFVLNFLKILFT